MTQKTTPPTTTFQRDADAAFDELRDELLAVAVEEPGDALERGAGVPRYSVAPTPFQPAP